MCQILYVCTLLQDWNVHFGPSDISSQLSGSAGAGAVCGFMSEVLHFIPSATRSSGHGGEFLSIVECLMVSLCQVRLQIGGRLFCRVSKVVYVC